MSDDLVLPESPTIQGYQAYIARMVEQRGFVYENLPEIMLLFVEEVGELAKVIRKSHGLHINPDSIRSTTEDEQADVFDYLLDNANNLGIDLEQAFRQKEAKNKLRTWSK